MELQNVLSEGDTTETTEQTQQVEQVEQVETTGEEAAPPAETKDDPIEKHRKGLEAATAAERQRRQAAEARAAQLEAELAKLQRPQAKTDDGPPDPANYQDNPQEYWRLLARYEARQELQTAVRHAQEQQKQQAQQKEQQELAERLNTLVMAGQAKYPDFDTAINNGLGPFLSPGLHAAIAESDVGHDVGYYLAKNPAEAARISRLSDRQMVREIAKLEAKITEPPKPKIPQTLTQTRDARGQFADAAYSGMTPLSDIVARK